MYVYTCGADGDHHAVACSDNDDDRDDGLWSDTEFDVVVRTARHHLLNLYKLNQLCLIPSALYISYSANDVTFSNPSFTSHHFYHPSRIHCFIPPFPQILSTAVCYYPPDCLIRFCSLDRTYPVLNGYRVLVIFYYLFSQLFSLVFIYRYLFFTSLLSFVFGSRGRLSWLNRHLSWCSIITIIIIIVCNTGSRRNELSCLV